MPDSNLPPERSRFSEPAKWLPVAFIWGNIICLWVIYMFLHCLPMLAKPATAEEAQIEIIVFNVLTFVLVICYIRCIVTHPGTIPSKQDGDSTWEYVPTGNTAAPTSALGLQETKRSGDRRHCKWCAKYKPDRCHHCRVCRQCILKMDHHCPWIYNCVGFGNHKYFFLLIFYATLLTNMIVWTMISSVTISAEAKTPFATMFFLIFGEALAAFLGLIVTCFFLFHVWLMFRGMTTIEFCEKSMKQQGYDNSNYNLGFYGNLTAVVGNNPLMWLLPCDPPTGDGINYHNEEKPIARDMEAGRGMRRPKRKVHRGLGAGTGEYAASEASLASSASIAASSRPPSTRGDLPSGPLATSERLLFHA